MTVRDFDEARETTGFDLPSDGRRALFEFSGDGAKTEASGKAGFNADVIRQGQMLILSHGKPPREGEPSLRINCFQSKRTIALFRVSRTLKLMNCFVYFEK